MRVLVTGSSGFVGSHLVTALKHAGHSVVLTDGLDLTDCTQASRIQFARLDAVIHLAALATVGHSFKDPMRYINSNASMQVNMFESALAQGANPRFLIVSSADLYSSQSTLPRTESSPIRPSSPYAVSKRLQEDLAVYYGLRGFDIIIARPFNHIGPGQREGFIAADLAKQIVAAEVGQENIIKVGNLDARRDYTDVRDIARAYCLLIEKGVSGNFYNVCSGRSVGGHELLRGLIACSGIKDLKAETDPAKIRPVEVLDVYGDYSKLHESTGWKPEISLDQTLNDILTDWRSRS